MPNIQETPQEPLDSAQIRLLLFISKQCDDTGMLSKEGREAVLGEASSDRDQIRYLFNRGLIHAKPFFGEAAIPLGLTSEGQAAVAELQIAN